MLLQCYLSPGDGLLWTFLVNKLRTTPLSYILPVARTRSVLLYDSLSRYHATTWIQSLAYEVLPVFQLRFLDGLTHIAISFHEPARQDRVFRTMSSSTSSQRWHVAITGIPGRTQTLRPLTAHVTMTTSKRAPTSCLGYAPVPGLSGGRSNSLQPCQRSFICAHATSLAIILR